MSKTYTVKSNLRHDGNVYRPGDSIELEAKYADVLLADGVIADPNEKPEDEVTLEPRKPKTAARGGAKGGKGKGAKADKPEDEDADKGNDEDEKPEDEKTGDDADQSNKSDEDEKDEDDADDL